MNTSSEKGTGTAWGKVILLGEHAVVHGSSALALSIGRCVRATAVKSPGPLALSLSNRANPLLAGDGGTEERALLQLAQALGLAEEGVRLTAEVDIPTRAGLGSSAALAAACARALASLFRLPISDTDLFEVVQASERVFHGTPSGLDATVALQGGILTFSRQHGARPVSADPPSLLVVDSKQFGDTKTTVARFKRRLGETGDEGAGRLARIAQLVERGTAALESGDLAQLGEVMTENHRLLSWFDVSTAALDGIVETALQAGALGAKLTGGGGGGCAVILIKPGDTGVREALTQSRFEVMAV